MTDRVTIDIRDGVADVRLNRPDKLNAFDIAMFIEVAAAIDGLATNTDVRCIVLSGLGRAFCVGIDLEFLSSGQTADLLPRYRGDANLFQYAAYGWRTLPQPVLVAIHGFAFGAGFQVMLGGDIRIAAPDAQFSIMEARWGLVADMGGYALMRDLVRTDVARELSFSARRVEGSEALSLGLVTRIANDPHAAAMSMARAIAVHPAEAVTANKRLHNLAASAGVGDILLQESIEQAALLASSAHRTILADALKAAAKPKAP
jgi:enoyl-CoA hydratase/carnithine racemase